MTDTDLRSQIEEWYKGLPEITLPNIDSPDGTFMELNVSDLVEFIQARDTKLKEALLGAVGEDEIPKMHLTGDAGVRLIARDELRAELRTAINKVLGGNDNE